MTEWQPIETAPRDGTEIIAYLSGEDFPDVINVCYYPEDEDGPGGWYDNYGGDYHPDFWMPLPDAPKKKHYCESFLSNWVCTDDRELPGLILVNHTGKIKVDYCPFCGEAANPTKDEPTMPFGMYASKKIAQLPNYYIDLLF